MPIFEYTCKSCGTEFEELVKSSDSPISCPECGSDDVEKLFSAFARRGGGCSGESCKTT